MNKKRTFYIPESVQEEDERQKNLARIFNKIKEIEEDKYTAVITSNSIGQNSISSFNKTVNSSGAAGFFTNGSTSTAAGPAIYGGN